jgi:hypothetical protein
MASMKGRSESGEATYTGATPPPPVKKRTLRRVLLVLLGLAMFLKIHVVIEGFFFEWAGAEMCATLLIAACCAFVLLFDVAIYFRRGRERFWTRTRICLLMIVLAGVPFPRFDYPRAAGYYMRAKLLADVPAVLAWADHYEPPPAAKVGPDGDVLVIPAPPELRSMGWGAEWNTKTHVVRIRNGGSMVGAWGLTVGHGVGSDPNCPGVPISPDAYVWSALGN